MSGGTFDYQQYNIKNIIEELQFEIDNNIKFNENGYCNNFNKKTINKFKKAIKYLNKTYDMIHLIDYLIACDIGEDDFNTSWKEKKL